MNLAENTATLSIAGTNVEDVTIPMIGLGTWPMTGSECTDAVLQGLEVGYRHIDTAHNYGNEDAVGEALRRTNVVRDQLFVTTKINQAAHGDLSVVQPAVEERLRALGQDYVDLLLIHWPNPDQGRYVETAAALSELISTGLIRSWGASNFKPAHLAALAAAGLKAPINQIQVDPLAAQSQLQSANSVAGTAIAAYSPMGRDIDLAEFEPLTAAAQRLGVTEHQVVLRWHVQSGRIAVPKSADESRQRANLDVFGFELTHTEMTAINALDTDIGPRLDADEFGH